MEKYSKSILGKKYRHPSEWGFVQLCLRGESIMKLERSSTYKGKLLGILKKAVLSIICLSVIGTITSCVCLRPQTCSPIITSITPEEVNLDDKPVNLVIQGWGFDKNSQARLFYLQEEILKMDFKSAKVKNNEMIVAVDEKWFKALRELPLPPTKISIKDRPLPGGFAVQVVNPDGRVSNVKSVRIKSICALIKSVSPKGPIEIAAGTKREIVVNVERRHRIGEILLKATAFEVPRIPVVTSRRVKISSGKQIPGIGGSVTIRGDEDSAILSLEAAHYVSPGEYKLVIDMPEVQGLYFAELVVSPVSCWTCPPAVPADLTVVRTMETSISMKWKDGSINENGFKIHRRFPGGQWSEVHSIGDHQGTGWMEWQDRGLLPNTQYCYRIKAFNDFGVSYSGEVCAKTIKALPDLAVGYIEWGPSGVVGDVYPDSLKPGQPFFIYVSYRNDGRVSTGPFTLRIEMGHYPAIPNVEGISYDFHRDSLEAGTGRLDAFWFSPGLPWDYTITAILDPDDEIPEKNENNNSNYVYIPVCP